MLLTRGKDSEEVLGLGIGVRVRCSENKGEIHSQNYKSAERRAHKLLLNLNLTLELDT
jgi:hypothetical protein